MKIQDFGKQKIEEKVSSTSLKRRVNNKLPIRKSPDIIEEEFPPIYGISEQQVSTLKRIRKLSPEAYDRMINWE
jgi:hypothetical protein